MSRLQQILIVVGLLVAIAGFVVYSKTSSNWQLCQTAVGQIVRVFDPRSSTGCANIHTAYDAALALMAAGGLLVLISLFVRPPAKS